MRVYRSEYRLCYAHRVWIPPQTYDETCRMIHGHTADLSLIVKYDSNKINHHQVARNVSELLAFMDAKVANRFIIDHADPMFYALVVSLYECLAKEYGVDISKLHHGIFPNITLPAINYEVANEVNLDYFHRAKDSPIYDVLKSYFITNFCPSSDNLAKWFFELADSHIGNIGATLDSVEWSSVPNRKVIYQRP